MGVTVINFYGGGAVPFAASIDEPSLVGLADMADLATGSIVTFTTNAGQLSATVTPSGGSGSYTFSWAITNKVENSDNGNRFSVNSAGTTNGPTYNTLTIDGARPAGAGQGFDAVFTATCTVSDGVSSDIAVATDFTVVGFAA
tara:strand:+ start:1740 stop:2168 length:429 start_codon:yes stop_codon:yes gene_type:complete